MKRFGIAILTGGILLGGLGGCSRLERDGFDCTLRNGDLVCDGAFDFDIPVLSDD